MVPLIVSLAVAVAAAAVVVKEPTGVLVLVLVVEGEEEEETEGEAEEAEGAEAAEERDDEAVTENAAPLCCGVGFCLGANLGTTLAGWFNSDALTCFNCRFHCERVMSCCTSLLR